MHSVPIESNYYHYGRTGPILSKKEYFSSYEPYPSTNLSPPIQIQQWKCKKTLKDLQSTISSADKPLMGMSYVLGTCVEKFYCVLCTKSKFFHMNQIVGHVTGNSHRMNYCVSNFVITTY